MPEMITLHRCHNPMPLQEQEPRVHDMLQQEKTYDIVLNDDGPTAVAPIIEDPFNSHQNIVCCTTASSLDRFMESAAHPEMLCTQPKLQYIFVDFLACPCETDECLANRDRAPVNPKIRRSAPMRGEQKVRQQFYTRVVKLHTRGRCSMGECIPKTFVSMKNLRLSFI